MNKYGIIFDCDGTLIDSLGPALESFNYALDQVNLPPRAPEVIKRHFGAGADRIFFNILGDQGLAMRAFEAYLDHQTELAKQMKLHDGIRELLDLATSREIPMGIVTGRHAKDLEIVLRPHKLGDYFQSLIADSHLPKSKPAPDGILLAAKQLGISPCDSIYVGDSIFDIKAAHAAGSIPVGALWDELAKEEELAIEKPEAMAKVPSEVWAFFTQRFNLKN